MTKHTPTLAVLRTAYIIRWADSNPAAAVIAGGEFDRCIAEHDREVRAAERERIYREVRGIPAWGTLEEREDHGGFDVPGQNARALVLAAIRTEPDDVVPGGTS